MPLSPSQAKETKQRFKHGYTYVYDVKDTKAGQVISGRRYPDAVAFDRAKSGKVSGVPNGRLLAFDVEDARGATEN